MWFQRFKLLSILRSPASVPHSYSHIQTHTHTFHMYSFLDVRTRRDDVDFILKYHDRIAELIFLVTNGGSRQRARAQKELGDLRGFHGLQTNSLRYPSVNGVGYFVLPSNSNTMPECTWMINIDC